VILFGLGVIIPNGFDGRLAQFSRRDRAFRKPWFV